MSNYYGTCPNCNRENARLYGTSGDRWCGKCNAKRRIPKLCKCGCGELTLNSYITGHNAKEIPAEEQRRRGLHNQLRDWSFRKAKPSTYLKILGEHEHRIVASLKLGRPLEKGEIVHHVDGNRHNNTPENLEVMTQSEHCKHHNFRRK